MKSNEVPSEEPENEPKVANVPNMPSSLSPENDACIVEQLPRTEAIGRSMVILIALCRR